MERIPEPEVMEDEEQAAAYARADFSSSNQASVDGLLEEGSRRLARVLDIGCGPADIAIRLARAAPSIHVTAVDASEAMVRLARETVREAGLDEKITVAKGQIPGLHVPGGDFDAIVSKDLLHHLPDPMVFWEEVKRLGRPGTLVYAMDLFRPQTQEAARDIVQSVSGGEPEILQRDFYNSLLAAFTLEEIEDQLRSAGLAFKVDPVSERHMCIRGSFQ